MSKTDPLVSIILLDYNSSKLTKKCVKSITEKLDYNNYKIILVDNSDDQHFSTEYLKKNDIIYIKNEQNSGFSGGCNIGIKYAYKNFQPQYYWLLNNDTIVEKHSLKALIKYTEQDHIAITGSKIINATDNKIQCLAGGYLNFLGKSSFITKPHSIKKLEYICGASMLISNTTIAKIGYLDEDFFLYYEDSEYCYRAIKNNLTIGYSSDSIIYHTESSTTGKIAENKIIFTTSSFIIFCLKTKKYITCFAGLILRLFFYLTKLKLSYVKSFFKAVCIGFRRVSK